MPGISPPLLNEVFVPHQCNYELRENNFLERRVKSVRYGTKSTSSLSPKIWQILLKDSILLRDKRFTLSKFLKQK